jgi:hypothetical protein
MLSNHGIIDPQFSHVEKRFILSEAIKKSTIPIKKLFSLLIGGGLPVGDCEKAETPATAASARRLRSPSWSEIDGRVTRPAPVLLLLPDFGEC